MTRSVKKYILKKQKTPWNSVNSVVKKTKRCTQRPYIILHELSIINYQLKKLWKTKPFGVKSSTS